MCLCVDADSYVCFSDRYNLGIVGPSVIEDSGGPCVCPCHDYPFSTEEEEMI